MTKDVIVTVSGLDIDSQDADSIEVVTTGKYLKKGDHSIVRFEEVVESVGITRNTVKFGDDHAEVSRSGAMEMYLYFYPGKKTSSDYKTPYGNMLVGINTTKYKLTKGEDTINIGIGYELSVNHEFLANCSININIRSAGNQ